MHRKNNLCLVFNTFTVLNQFNILAFSEFTSLKAAFHYMAIFFTSSFEQKQKEFVSREKFRLVEIRLYWLFFRLTLLKLSKAKNLV